MFKLRQLALVLAASMGLTACGLGPADSVRRPPLGPFDATRVLLQIEQTWYQTGPGSGAYGYVFNLESTPSLYATAWHLRLAAQIGAPLPELSRAETAAWLGAVLDGHGPFQGIDRLQSVHLATQAIHDLQSPIPASAGRAVEDLRRGGLYRSDVDAEPDWPATANAVDTLVAAGLKPPGEVVQRLKAALPVTTTTAGNVDSWLRDLLPQWDMADQLLSDQERAPLRRDLAEQLRKLRAVAAGAPLSEVTLFVMANLVMVARANGVRDLEYPPSAYAGLLAPAGFVATSPDDPRPSMKNTYQALVLGLKPGRQLFDYLRYSAAPRGWRMDVGPPDVKASYYALEVSRSLGKRDHEEDLKAQAEKWLTEASTALAQPAGRKSFDGVYFTLLLAQALGLPFPSGLRDNFVTLSESGSDQVPDSALLSLGRISLLLSESPGERLAARLRDLLPHLDLGHMTEIAAAAVVAQVIKDRALEERVRTAAGRLSKDALYMTREGAPVADLRSTALGTLVATSARPAPTVVAATFADSRGFWLLPHPGAPDNVVDVETLYLGQWLTGALPETGGIL